MDEYKLFEQVKSMAYEGMAYEDIRRKMKDQITDPDLLRTVMVKANQHIVEYQLALQEKARALNQMIIGAVILILGVGITIYTYFSLQNQYVLVYGAILVGAWILKEGYKKYNQPIENFIPKSRKF